MFNIFRKRLIKRIDKRRYIMQTLYNAADYGVDYAYVPEKNFKNIVKQILKRFELK